MTRYCQNCGYVLDGLPENRCPECGRAFDPASDRTFRVARPLPRWIGRLVKWFLAAVIVLALITFARSAVRSFRAVLVTEVNVADASVRTCAEYYVWDIRLRRDSGQAAATCLTPFLLSHGVTQKSKWVRGGHVAYDYWGFRRDYYMPHGIAQVTDGRTLAAESLPHAWRSVPDLGRMIQVDILDQESPGMSSALMYVLREMCKNPTEENIRIQLAKWEWTKRHPASCWPD